MQDLTYSLRVVGTSSLLIDARPRVGFNYDLVLSSLFLAKLQELATLNLANPFAIAP
jgi:hypothetical protein